MITLDRLKTLLHYDPLTGVFTRLRTVSSNALAGTKAGSITPAGYFQVGVDGGTYLAHRLAIFYVSGAWPQKMVDHRNHKKDDNRWENIRPATGTQNQGNRRINKTSTSGYKGVRWHERHGRWYASITINGHNTHLGNFGSAEEAHKAYVKAAEAHFGEFARAA